MRLIPVVCAGLLLAAVGCRRPAPAPEPSSEAPATSAPAPVPPAPASPADNRPVLVAFGDSLTSGIQGSYPWFLQRDLDRAGYHWRVINEGVAGDTTTNALLRLGSVIADQPEIVVVEFGGNDGLRGVPVASTRANLDRIITALEGARITVVLAGITLPPNYGPDYIGPFEHMYRDLAARHHLTLLPFLLEGVALVEGMMSEDGIHPTVKGNEQVARNVFRVLKPLLDKREGRPDPPRQ